MAEQVEGAPTECSRCGAALCIRKQVLNLALGNVEALFLPWLFSSKRTGDARKLGFGDGRLYYGRDCFRKEWVRYKGVEDCPAPTTCIPQTCFNKVMNKHDLDLRGVACPMNFVKTRLFLDKVPAGDVLNVLLDAGEPVESVTSSVGAEGHAIESQIKCSEGHYLLIIRKV